MTDTTAPVAPTSAPGLFRETWPRWELLLLLGITFVGLLLRLWMRPLTVWPLGDAVHYLNQARYGAWNTTWSPVGEQWWLPPSFPFLTSLLLGGSTDPAVTLDRAVLVNIIAGTLLIPALYLVTRPLLGWPPAIWTALLAMANPFLVAYSTTAISEPLYMLLLIVLWACGLRWAAGDERTRYATTLVGVALFLTRAFGIVQFPLVYLGIWWTRRQLQRSDACFFKHSLSAWAIFLVVTGLTIGKASIEQGSFALDGKSRYQFMRLSAPDLTSETPDPNYEGMVTSDGRAYAPATPWFAPLTGTDLLIGQARKYVLRQRRLWSSWLTDAIPPYSIPLFDPLTLLLIGAGCWRLRRDRLPASWRLWPPLLAGVLLIQPLTFAEPRYFITLLPLTLPLAGFALCGLVASLSDQLQAHIEPRITQGLAAATILGCGLLVLAPYAQWTRTRAVQYNPPREMAQILREAMPLPDRIFDTAGSTAYYLGIEGWVIPDVGPDQLAAWCKAHQLAAIVLDERMARGKHNRPLLQFLYDQPADYPAYGFSLIAWKDRPEGRGWRLYAVDP